jgi:hypothetical protein
MSRVSRLVRVVDTEAALPLVTKVYEALYGEDAPKGLRVERQAIIVGWNEKEETTDVGSVCTEGVGHWTRSDNTLGIWCGAGMHQFTIPLGLDIVPLAADPIDFADHVRTFGSRLEVNWHLWERAAAGVTKVPSHMERFVA